MSRNLTQVGSSFVGTMEEFETDSIRANGTTIHIADHQTDAILDDITEDAFWNDNHKKSLPTTLETFDFTTFADKSFSEYLTKRNRVIIPDEDGQLVEFYITNTRKYRSQGALKCDVRTSATYVTLKKAKVIDPHTTNALSAESHAISALANTEWEVGTIAFEGVRTLTFDEHTNPYSYLKRIASEFNLELHFRVESNGNRIVRRYVDMVERIGAWRGREVEFGKDLEGIERKENFSNIVTALVGIGPEKEDGTRLEVLVEDEDALQRWGRNGQHLIEVYEPQSSDQDMTEARLRTLTENELEKRINSVVEYRADVIDLENVPGLEHEQFRDGDTIRIKDLKFNPPLYLEARVNTIERSIKRKGRKTVELGDYVEFTEDQVNAIIKVLQSQLKQKISESQLLELTYSQSDIDSKDSTAKSEAVTQSNSYTDNNALVKEKTYTNGLYWDETDGLYVLKSNDLMRTVLNATRGIAIQRRSSITDPWEDIFYVDTEGNIKFAGELDGATGIFKGSVQIADTTIDESGLLTNEGDIRVKDEVTQIETSLMSLSNMVNDHSFELVPLGTGSWAHATRRVDYAKMQNFYNWMIVGEQDYARIQSTLETSDYQRAKYGFQAAILEQRYYWTQYLRLDTDRLIDGPYTISAYFSAYEGTNETTTCRLLVHAYDDEFNLTQTSSVGGFNIDVNPSEPYTWKRAAATFTNLPAGTVYLRVRIDQITGDSTRALCDGVQMVPIEYPTMYQPEDSLWNYLNGVVGYSS